MVLEIERRFCDGRAGVSERGVVFEIRRCGLLFDLLFLETADSLVELWEEEVSP